MPGCFCTRVGSLMRPADCMISEIESIRRHWGGGFKRILSDSRVAIGTSIATSKTTHGRRLTPVALGRISLALNPNQRRRPTIPLAGGSALILTPIRIEYREIDTTGLDKVTACAAKLVPHAYISFGPGGDGVSTIHNSSRETLQNPSLISLCFRHLHMCRCIRCLAKSFTVEKAMARK